MLPGFREACAARDLRPFEALTPGDTWSERTPRLAKGVMERGWRGARAPRVRLEPPVDWDGAAAGDRAAQNGLHAWAPLGILLAAYDHDGDEACLEFAAAAGIDWVRAHPSRQGGSHFAWYDHAVALRAYRLAYLLDCAARAPAFSDEDVDRLCASLLLHRDALAAEDSFSAHSNHGIYQAVGELAMAQRFPDLPGMAESAERGFARLLALIDAHFTGEGVHKEHSPGYHWAMAELLGRLELAGLHRPEITERRERIEEALAWFFQPDGALVTFGDTSRQVIAESSARFASQPALRFVLTRGRQGAEPAERMRAFPRSGYAVVRDGMSSYLAQACAFHSRTHKHADDLSFVWFARGRELVVDSGRYPFAGRTEPDSELWQLGFNYDDPRRVYVESTKAHNTVEIDGRSHSRRVKPYGSALEAWHEHGGIASTLAAVTHGGVRHQRLLVSRPRAWLAVVDVLEDAAGGAHDFAQRFHFAPDLDVVSRGEALELAAPGADWSLSLVPLIPNQPLPVVRGQDEPELLGWVSRGPQSLTPAWTGGYAARGSLATFATLLSIEAGAARPVPGEILVSRDRVRLAWQSGSRQVTVEWEDRAGLRVST